MGSFGILSYIFCFTTLSLSTCVAAYVLCMLNYASFAPLQRFVVSPSQTELSTYNHPTHASMPFSNFAKHHRLFFSLSYTVVILYTLQLQSTIIKSIYPHFPYFFLQNQLHIEEII